MKNKNKARKGPAEIYLRTAESAAQRDESEAERRTSRWILEGIPVLIAKDFSDSEDPNPQPIAALKGEAMRDIEELARQIRRCCSDKKWSSYQKRVACEELVKVAFESVESVFSLARKFPKLFREIAEECSHFPCLFPAQADELPSLKSTLWDDLNLGKRHTFKLRAAHGRKTFSRKTWVNKLLLDLIGLAYKLAREESDRDPHDKYSTALHDVVEHVPLTRESAKEWLDVIWGLLLNGIPNPEMEPRLRQLGNFPSRRKKGMNPFGTVGAKTQATNIRATIKARLGLYLERMLNEQSVHK